MADKERMHELVVAGMRHDNTTVKLAAALLAAELHVAHLAELVLASMQKEVPDTGWTPEYEVEYTNRGYDRLYMATLQDEDMYTMQEHLAAALEANC